MIVMKQEDKELLLRYLSMALPYDLQVKAEGDNEPYTLLSVHPNKDIALIGIDMDGVYATSKVKIDTIKPYLRPLSSMTEDEREYFEGLSDMKCTLGYAMVKVIFCLKRHLDINGLIPKGLAIEVTENNPYKD